MPNSRRVVILGSSVTALAVARNAHRLGMKASVADTRAGIAFSSREARPALLSGGDEGGLVGQIVGLAREGREPCLLATSDSWLRFLRRWRRELTPAFARILHPGDDVLDLCLDKVAFGRWCAARGLPTPRCGTPGDGLRPPLLIRPRHTLHDEPRPRLPKAAEARTDEQAAALLKLYEAAGVEPALSESLLGRDLAQWSVALARRGGEAVAYTACKVRPTADRCSVGTYVVSRRDDVLEGLGRRVADALGLDGMAEVEVLRDRRTGEDFVIEANLRPWSQYSMAAVLGFDFLGFVLGVRSGAARPRPAPVAWMDLTGDLYNLLSRGRGLLRRGKAFCAEFLTAFLRAEAFSTFDTRDPWPFVQEMLALLRR